jgi:hypothetical protein
LGWAAATKMGLNDASGVVWALCKCLFSFAFLTLINVFALYLGSTDKIQVRMKEEAGDNENGPKRVVWALGAFFSFFKYSVFIYNWYITLY